MVTFEYEKMEYYAYYFADDHCETHNIKIIIPADEEISKENILLAAREKMRGMEKGETALRVLEDALDAYFDKRPCDEHYNTWVVNGFTHIKFYVREDCKYESRGYDPGPTGSFSRGVHWVV